MQRSNTARMQLAHPASPPALVCSSSLQLPAALHHISFQLSIPASALLSSNLSPSASVVLAAHHPPRRLSASLAVEQRYTNASCRGLLPPNRGLRAVLPQFSALEARPFLASSFVARAVTSR